MLGLIILDLSVMPGGTGLKGRKAETEDHREDEKAYPSRLR